MAVVGAVAPLAPRYSGKFSKRAPQANCDLFCILDAAPTFLFHWQCRSRHGPKPRRLHELLSTEDGYRPYMIVGLMNYRRWGGSVWAAPDSEKLRFPPTRRSQEHPGVCSDRSSLAVFIRLRNRLGGRVSRVLLRSNRRSATRCSSRLRLVLRCFCGRKDRSRYGYQCGGDHGGSKSHSVRFLRNRVYNLRVGPSG